ncbi:MAG: class I SAM-dependent methyltransferase, partial [Candidatus Aenigmatarchaeota archaeon]
LEPEADLISDAKACNPKVTFERGRAEEMDFEEDKFNLIVSWTVLQHIPDKTLESVAKEMKRVVKPSGNIILAEETRGDDWGSGWVRSEDEYENLFKPFSISWKKYRDIGRDFL